MGNQRSPISYQPRPGLQPGAEKHLRQVADTEVADNFEQAPLKYIAIALVHLRNAFTKVPVMLQDYSRPVDEYDAQTSQPEGTQTLTLTPQWEVPERIESIIITGPPAASVILQLGDRFWPIVIPATGVFTMGPMACYIGRGDIRQLTAPVAGNYTLELMGHADTRGNLI